MVLAAEGLMAEGFKPAGGPGSPPAKPPRQVPRPTPNDCGYDNPKACVFPKRQGGEHCVNCDRPYGGEGFSSRIERTGEIVATTTSPAPPPKPGDR